MIVYVHFREYDVSRIYLENDPEIDLFILTYAKRIDIEKEIVEKWVKLQSDFDKFQLEIEKIYFDGKNKTNK